MKATKPRASRILNREPHRDQIDAAYLLIGDSERNKRLVAEIWRTMFDYAPAGRMGGVTLMQRQVYDFIVEYIQEHGQSPLYREIGEVFNQDRKWAHYVCRELARKKIISIGGCMRAIKLIKQPGDF